MKNTQHTHTPGPWKAQVIPGPYHQQIMTHPDCRQIALARHWPDMDGTNTDIAIGETEANARLIAAAPDLLAALKRAEACFIDISKGAKLTGENLSNWAKAASVLLPLEAEKARAAIAKAEGVK